MHKYILFLLTIAISAGSFAQEYTYDSEGNLAADSNKQIASIHYNCLNLVDTITYTDGRRIIYTYLSSGQKLREQAIDAGGHVIHHKQYIGSYLYDNDTLREIQDMDARTVPTTPGGSATAWEYQYHLKDHLGNVRSTLTSAPQSDHALASFEDMAASSGFLRYEDARRINALLFDHTKTGATHYAQRLNGSANERYGIARSISVMPGDTVKLEVFAKYIDPNTANRTAALTTLLAQIAAGTAAAGTVVDGTGYATSGATPFPFAGLNNTSASTGAGPKAYLNWLVFNRDFTFRTGGFVQMTTAAKENGSNVSHERLASTFTMDAPGYVYVYLSNEEATPLEVYFDDLSVTQVMGPVIQQTDYDPFGLTVNEYKRESTAPNNFLYNSKELQKDFDLNWYDYGARMYDVALGRWHMADPMAEKYSAWSPYSAVANNPIKFVDPDGQDFVIWYREDRKTKSYRFDGKLSDKTKIPDNAFVKAFIKAYQYDTDNGGGENLKSVANSRKIKVDVVMGLGPSTSPDNTGVVVPQMIKYAGKNGYNGNGKITWSPVQFRASSPTAQSVSAATVLEGLAFQANMDATDHDRYLDLLAKDPSGEYHHLIDRAAAEGPERVTAIANHEIGPDEQVQNTTKHELWGAVDVTSTQLVEQYERDQLNIWKYIYSIQWEKVWTP